MKRRFAALLGVFVLTSLVSTSAFAAKDRDGGGGFFDPVERMLRKVERVLRGLGDVLTLPKP